MLNGKVMQHVHFSSSMDMVNMSVWSLTEQDVSIWGHGNKGLKWQPLTFIPMTSNWVQSIDLTTDTQHTQKPFSLSSSVYHKDREKQLWTYQRNRKQATGPEVKPEWLRSWNPVAAVEVSEQLLVMCRSQTSLPNELVLLSEQWEMAPFWEQISSFFFFFVNL